MNRRKPSGDFADAAQLKGGRRLGKKERRGE